MTLSSLLGAIWELTVDDLGRGNVAQFRIADPGAIAHLSGRPESSKGLHCLNTSRTGEYYRDANRRAIFEMGVGSRLVSPIGHHTIKGAVMAWLWLVCAIALEVVATSSLKAAEGFTHFWPSLVVVVGYCGSTLMLGLTLKTFDIGMVYAIWSGVGTALILLIGIAVFDEQATSLRIVGIALIIVGLVMLNLSGRRQESPHLDDRAVVISDVTQAGGGDPAWDAPLNGG